MFPLLTWYRTRGFSTIFGWEKQIWQILQEPKHLLNYMLSTTIWTQVAYYVSMSPCTYWIIVWWLCIPCFVWLLSVHIWSILLNWIQKSILILTSLCFEKLLYSKVPIRNSKKTSPVSWHHSPSHFLSSSYFHSHTIGGGHHGPPRRHVSSRVPGVNQVIKIKLQDQDAIKRIKQ